MIQYLIIDFHHTKFVQHAEINIVFQLSQKIKTVHAYRVKKTFCSVYRAFYLWFKLVLEINQFLIVSKGSCKIFEYILQFLKKQPITLSKVKQISGIIIEQWVHVFKNQDCWMQCLKPTNKILTIMFLNFFLWDHLSLLNDYTCVTSRAIMIQVLIIPNLCICLLGTSTAPVRHRQEVSLVFCETRKKC